MALPIKKGDIVKILSGKDRGKTAKVLRVLPREARIVVDGVNIHKRHQRARKAGEKGQILSIPSPLSVSNAMLVCPSCSRPTRPRWSSEGSVKGRVCRKCGAAIH
ncbi:MAG: 50S ribosomal protein L24 [Candidatus Niyogibacteria bacterium]|nr:50S ribosomal protein L24 [Candidatus Niyogibacteria bacterium]